jgi:hypothetical protein
MRSGRAVRGLASSVSCPCLSSFFQPSAMLFINSSVYMTEKDCKVSFAENNLSFAQNIFMVAILCLLVFLICLAGIVDMWRGWRERVKRRLADDLWRFPKSFRALLKDCGPFITDRTVQKYLQAIIRGFEDSRTLLRMGEVERASQRFAYVKLCFHKARLSAETAACNARSQELLLACHDDQYLDEVAISNDLIARRRAEN